jgi:hypothetical protein
LRGGKVFRVLPEEWVPLMKIAYEELKSITSRMGVDVVLAGAGAYSIHVEADSTKDVDFILSKPLDVKILVEILEKLAERLEMRGFNVIGRRIQQDALLPASLGGLTPPPSGLSVLRSDARTSSFSASPF